MAEFFPDIPLSADILSRTPPEVIDLLARLLAENKALREEISKLKARIEELEARLNKNSSNSSKPPSSDSPYNPPPKPEKPPKNPKPRKRIGTRQQCLRPTHVEELHPEKCSCGCRDFYDEEHYYTHQVIELPTIQALITHFGLYRARCRACGKMVKAHIPHDKRSGFGARFCATVAELVGVHGDSRRAVQDFFKSVFNIPISQGGIQNVLDRVSRAIAPHYEAIGETVRKAPVNHADETPWKRQGALNYLWLLCNNAVAYFMIHGKRSREAFQALIKEWEGILVSDGYAVYRDWLRRQSCLAHLIRDAKGLCEHSNPDISRPGRWILSELRRLCHMAKERPTVGEWRMFYARLLRFIGLYRERKKCPLGRFARRVERELDSLWVFLEEHGVSPTNNHAERTLRFAVLWRRRSFGSRNEKGERFVERILSLRQTCRLHGRSTFTVLVDALEAFFTGASPNLGWIQALVRNTP
jgi:transposase